MKTMVIAMERSLPGLAPRYWGMYGILLAALAGLFLIGLDQGQAISTVMGQVAYQQSMLHELFHDVRHVAGFACH